MLDNSVMLLRDAGKETGHIFESHDGNIEAIAEAHKSCALDRTVDVQHAGEISRLVGDDTNRTPIKPSEAYDNVRRVITMSLKEIPIVDYQIDYFVNVVRLVRGFGND